MYAKVESARGIRTPLLYNEMKVEAKQALFLDAHNFWQDKDDLTLRDKLQRFNNLTVLNERSGKKIIHCSINFHPDDQLTDKMMTRIAREFMKGIDFGEQPWLVYRHNDAGHPHMHIVTTNIRPDGSRISNDLRSPKNLEAVCAGIEKAHHLTPVRHQPENLEWRNDKDMQRLSYGKIPTRTGIERVLNYVLREYTFHSFESYNAVLGLYNVKADRGNPNGRMYQGGGLYYRLIDETGKKLGAPIKASDFNIPVTLKAIEEKCRLHQSQALSREQTRSRERISLCIRYDLVGKTNNLEKWRQDLSRQRIHVVFPTLTLRPRRGIAPIEKPGIFYIDFEQKIAFKDTQLGQDCTAASVLGRLGLEQNILGQRKLLVAALEQARQQLQQQQQQSQQHRHGHRL